ncbi:MAG: hypothetical protein ACNA7J_01690, partial [Wenzhouxiangella sp.]
PPLRSRLRCPRTLRGKPSGRFRAGHRTAQATGRVRFAEGKKRSERGRLRVFRSLEIVRLCLRSRALPEAGSEALNVC